MKFFEFFSRTNLTAMGIRFVYFNSLFSVWSQRVQFLVSSWSKFRSELRSDALLYTTTDISGIQTHGSPYTSQSCILNGKP